MVFFFSSRRRYVSGRHSAFKTRYVHTPALGVHCTCRIWAILICEFLTEWEGPKKYSRFLQLRAAVWDFFSVLLQVSIFRPQNCYALEIFFGGIQIYKRTECKNERKSFSCEDKKFQLSGRNYVTISWNLHLKGRSASLSVSKKIQYMYPELKRHSPNTPLISYRSLESNNCIEKKSHFHYTLYLNVIMQ